MKAGHDTGHAWQRVKVALTGLAAVLVLIGLASLIVGSVRRERPVAVPGGPRPDAMANSSESNAVDPAEPLAELGVTPSAQANGADPAARTR